MKLAVFGVLACCLVLSQAAVVPEEPIEQSVRTLDEYAESLNEKAEQISKEVDQRYDEIVVQPIERVGASAEAIEQRKEESEECVEQEASEVEIILLNFEETLDGCTQQASRSGFSVAVSISRTSAEITYDTYKLVKSVQRCRRYKNSILKSSCYARQLIRAKILVTKTRRAIQSLNQSVDETLPTIVVDLAECSATAEQTAQAQLELINRNIDNCVAKL